MDLYDHVAFSGPVVNKNRQTGLEPYLQEVEVLLGCKEFGTCLS